MTYDIEFIKQTWLVDGVIAYTEKQVVDAFNEVQSTMGQEWLDSLKFTNGIEQIGAQVTISVVELGLKLSLLKKGINYTSLVTKLKSHLDIEVAKGMAELNAIYFICNEIDIDFELEPTVAREGNGLRPQSGQLVKLWFTVREKYGKNNTKKTYTGIQDLPNSGVRKWKEPGSAQS